jgi:hypothetical protein
MTCIDFTLLLKMPAILYFRKGTDLNDNVWIDENSG